MEIKEIDGNEDQSSSDQEDDKDQQKRIDHSNQSNHNHPEDDQDSNSDSKTEIPSETITSIDKTEAKVKHQSKEEKQNMLATSSSINNLFPSMFIEKPDLSKSSIFDGPSITTVKSPKAKTLGERLLENIEFSIDGGPLCTEFVNGSLAERYQENPSDDLQFQYLRQCLISLDWTCSDNLIKAPNMLSVYANAIEEMNHYIKHAFSSGGLLEPEIMREKLPLETAPFKYAKKVHLNIQELHKDDEIRVAFQALFLFVLRLFIPLKYENIESFLEKYPELKERNPTEQERLRNTANWMDLTFYTVQPRNNKTFLLNLIPRIVEGKAVKYITGSGQTKSTSDRVNLFRSEGNCEKIKRPPRRKKEEILMANAMKMRSEKMMENSFKAGPGDSLNPFPGFPGPFPPFMFPYYPPGMLQPKDLQRYKAWQQQAMAASFGAGVLPSDSHRVATYQEKPLRSADSSPILEANQMGFPWYPPTAAALPPPTATVGNTFYTDLLQSRGRVTGSNANSSGNDATSGFPPPPPPFMFPPYDYRYAMAAGGYNPRMLPTTTTATSSSSSSSGPAANANAASSSSSSALPFGYPQPSHYIPFTTGASSHSNESNLPAFPFIGFPGGNAFPPNIQNPATSAYLYQNSSNHYNNSSSNSNSNSKSDSNQSHGNDMTTTTHHHNHHHHQLSELEGQVKRRKGSGSPTSSDYASRLSSVSLQLPSAEHHQIDEGLLKSSASTSSEGGLDVLLAVAGTIDDSPKDP